MKPLLLFLFLVSAPALGALPAPGEPGAPNDPRYCGEPARYADGSIKRSSAQLGQFTRTFPCPATLNNWYGGCTGWQINHLIPLSRGGCDTPLNMWWAPVQIKTCREGWCIDRWELKYHSFPRQPIVIEPITP